MSETQQFDRRRARFTTGYGWVLLGLLALQFVAVNVFMFWYAIDRSWDVSDTLMQTWLAATVIELIGVVHVVVSHLFPKPKG